MQNSNRPFDLGKLDFEGIRKRRRKKLLLFSLPVCIIVGLVAIKMLSIPILSSVAHGQYKNKQYDATVGWMAPLNLVNIFEPYIVSYNQGNAFYKKGDFVKAEERYRKALEMVPAKHECSVRINLSLSIEAQADRLVNDKKYDEAIVRYDEIKAILRDGEDSCSVKLIDDHKNQPDKKDDSKDKQDESGGEDSQNETERQDENQSRESNDQQDEFDQSDNKKVSEKLEERVIKKSNDAKKARNQDNFQDSESTSDDQNSEKTDDIKNKIKKLEDISSQSQLKMKQRQQSNSNDYEISSRRYETKVW